MKNLFEVIDKKNKKLILQLLIDRIMIDKNKDIKTIVIKFDNELQDSLIKMKGEPKGSSFVFYMEI